MSPRSPPTHPPPTTSYQRQLPYRYIYIYIYYISIYNIVFTEAGPIWMDRATCPAVGGIIELRRAVGGLIEPCLGIVLGCYAHGLGKVVEVYAHGHQPQIGHAEQTQNPWNRERHQVRCGKVCLRLCTWTNAWANIASLQVYLLSITSILYLTVW